jgi:hypothetical protein
MSESKPKNDNSGEPQLLPDEAPAPDTLRPSRSTPKRRTKKQTGSSTAVYQTVELAAASLSLDPAALRARLRRAQRDDGAGVVADLGGGISAFKLGKSWRIRFPAH